MALVAASTEASNDEGSRPILIPILSGSSGGSGTGRGNPSRGTVEDAYISEFSEVSSKRNFTSISLEICAQGKIVGKIYAKTFVYVLKIYLETPRITEKIKNKRPVMHRVKFQISKD